MIWPLDYQFAIHVTLSCWVCDVPNPDDKDWQPPQAIAAVQPLRAFRDVPMFVCEACVVRQPWHPRAEATRF